MITDFRPLNMFPRTSRWPLSFSNFTIRQFCCPIHPESKRVENSCKKITNLLKPKEAKLQRPPGRIWRNPRTGFFRLQVRSKAGCRVWFLMLSTTRTYRSSLWVCKLSAHAGPHLTPFSKLVVLKISLFSYIKVGQGRHVIPHSLASNERWGHTLLLQGFWTLISRYLSGLIFFVIGGKWGEIMIRGRSLSFKCCTWQYTCWGVGRYAVQLMQDKSKFINLVKRNSNCWTCHHSRNQTCNGSQGAQHKPHQVSKLALEDSTILER